MNYREEINVADTNKKDYSDSFEDVIKYREAELKKERAEYIKEIFENPDRYRTDFKKMLGWPLLEEDKYIPNAEIEKLSEEKGYCVYRIQFTLKYGLKVSGLFFKMKTEGKRPLVIVQHGGQGTPELISGVYGDTSNYNEMLSRVIKHNVHAFAPQFLLWNKETYDIQYDRVNIDARLKRVGSSITAIEIYSITKILDYFEEKEYVGNFAMVGLSYGGFYTLFTAAVEERIKSAISCSFFNTRDEYPWNDWTWTDAAAKFDDAEIACLVYPRKLCIEIADNDELFDYKHGLKSFERVKEICKNVGTDWINLILFEGVHEFCKDDEPIRKLIMDIE